MMEQKHSDNFSKCREALRCWFITGATASGKNDVSIELAKRLDAEIVLLDSMTIYRGMDIGTAKPTPEKQRMVPHHLVDIADPNESFSVTQYRDLALKAIAEIRERGRQVIFVGGTALYLKAMLRGLFEGPPADWEFRTAIDHELESVNLSELHKRLELVDPLAAHKLHPNDKRRIVRALEVHHLTGRPISHLQREFETVTPSDQCRVFALHHDRAELHRRIERRVDGMFADGIVDEVQGLLDRWQQLSRTASQAVGYREVIHHVQNEVPLETTKEKVLFRTRQFARHQETWFRGLAECEMVQRAPNDSTEETVAQIIELGQSRQLPGDENAT